MEEREIEQIAAKVVEKLMEPERRQALAEAIAAEIRQLAVESRIDLERLGRRLDERGS